MPVKPSITRYSEELAEIFADQKSVIFLCGPSLSDTSVPGAKLRQDLERDLIDQGFEVVLGEDDGLESLRKLYKNYAHDNELEFIKSQCNAVVLIASSAGSLCELGLFAYDKVHRDNNKTDFILIIDAKYRDQQSYISEGPAQAIHDYGIVFYGDLSKFDYEDIVERLKRRRAVFLTDMRGRPPGGAS